MVVKAYALLNHMAQTVAWTLFSKWILSNGLPLFIHRDRSAKFEGKLMKDLYLLTSF